MAFRCFFKLLFGGTLPAEAAEYLPESARPALPEARASEPDKGKDKRKSDQKTPAKAKAKAKTEAETRKPDEAKKPEKKPETKPEKKPAPAGPSPAKVAEHHRDGALALLALLQREGRLIDFLRESLDDYEDSDIGATVRDIHRGCSKVLTEHIAMEPVMPGDEDDDVTVPKGFDPGEVRLIGEISGDPPFKGTMRHHGWRVTKASLPTLSDGMDRHIVAPAEVEVS